MPRRRKGKRRGVLLAVGWLGRTASDGDGRVIPILLHHLAAAAAVLRLGGRAAAPAIEDLRTPQIVRRCLRRRKRVLRPPLLSQASPRVCMQTLTLSLLPLWRSRQQQLMVREAEDGPRLCWPPAAPSAASVSQRGLGLAPSLRGQGRLIGPIQTLYLPTPPLSVYLPRRSLPTLLSQGEQLGGPKHQRKLKRKQKQLMFFTLAAGRRR